MKQKLSFILICLLIGAWALAAAAVFIYYVSTQFECSFIKALLYAILSIIWPIAIIGIDSLAERIKEHLQYKSSLPDYLTEKSLQLVSIVLSIVIILSVGVALIFAAWKIPI